MTDQFNIKWERILTGTTLDDANSILFYNI